MNTKNIHMSERKKDVIDVKATPQPRNNKEHSSMQIIKKLPHLNIKRNTKKATSKITKTHKDSQSFNAFSKKISKTILGASLLLSCNLSFAANSDGYAFTGALFKIMNELQGAPIALITAIGIMAAGFLWVFKGHDVGIKQVISALVGGGLVIAAPSLVMMVPGMAGAII